MAISPGNLYFQLLLKNQKIQQLRALRGSLSCHCPFWLGMCPQIYLARAPLCLSCSSPGEVVAPGSTEPVGSPGDRSGLSLANQGQARALVCVRGVFSPEETCRGALLVCPPACQRSGPGLHGTLLPTFSSSPASRQPARLGIVWGRKHTHVIGTPDQRQRPRAASQWFLCADGSLRGGRTQAERRGWEGGAGQRYLSPREACRRWCSKRRQVGDAPSSPQEVASPVGILRKHGPVCGVSGRDNSGWAPRSGLRLPWVRVIRAKAVWSPRVAGTCPWAQRQRKPKWHGLEEAASVVGDGITSGQVARLLRHSCLQLTFLKSPLCARPRVV